MVKGQLMGLSVGSKVLQQELSKLDKLSLGQLRNFINSVLRN